MPSLILHQYEMSPFSEKVRRIFAFKSLPYESVRAPAVMPKPDLVALTGGYRKIPVLQSGNHVYCDTSLIARVIERAAPEPTLYPNALAQSFAEWADSALFDATVPVALRPTRIDDILKWLTPDEMTKFGDDRRAMGEDARRRPPPGKVARAYLAVYFARLDAALKTDRYVLGSAPSIADFSVYHCAWFVRSLAPELVAPHTHLLEWLDRIAALPDPKISALSSDDALARCRAGSPEWHTEEAFDDPMGLTRGQAVVVKPFDYGRDPVQGELVHSTLQELVLRRSDERAGVVFVHFPRIGYELTVVK